MPGNKRGGIWFREVVHGAVASVPKMMLATKRVVENEKALVDCSLACGGLAGRCAGFNVSEPTRATAGSNERIDADSSGADDGRRLC
jgi:hypothetical protein